MNYVGVENKYATVADYNNWVDHFSPHGISANKYLDGIPSLREKQIVGGSTKGFFKALL